MMDNKEEKKDTPQTQEPVGADPKIVKDQPKAAPAPKAAPVKKAPGKFALFMRKMLQTIVVLLVIFGAGVVTGYFLLQRPAVDDLSGQVDNLEGDKAGLESQVGELEAEVAELNGQLEALPALEAEIQSLETSLASEKLHVQVLSVLRDVQSAQVALADGDVQLAGVSLSRTADKLEALRTLLPAENQGVVDDMVQRLELSLNGLEGDNDAAASDLSVLANLLVKLENSRFTTP